MPRALELPVASERDHRAPTAVGLLRARAQAEPAGIATRHRLPDGEWVPTTWNDLWQQVRRAASAFSSLGLKRGDRLAIMARTSREWQLAELGAAAAQAAVIGIDPFAAPQEAIRVFLHLRPAALVVDTELTLAKIPVELQRGLKFVLIFSPEPREGVPQAVAWRDAVVSHPSADLPGDADPDGAAAVIYTSGSSGDPKGIEYSHRQVMTACWAMADAFPDFDRSRAVCWLPMSALFQRMMNVVALANGSTTYFVEDPREIMHRLQEIRPSVLTSVPRFYEKVHDGIQERLAGRSRLEQRLVRWALAAGDEWARQIRSGSTPGFGLRMRHAVLDAVVLRRVRRAMGGEVRWLISGSAACPRWLLEFFDAIGLPILEAYGITENPVPVAANRPAARRLGSVGRPLPPNTVQVDADGEVLVKGPALFTGYVGQSVESDRLAGDGFYRTGDFGYLDPDGFLFLTGRANDLIKTSGGRRIGPAAIEGVYRQSRYIDQIIVVGNDRPHLAALIWLNRAAVEAELGRDTGRATTVDLTEESVATLVRREMSALGKALAAHQQVRVFAVVTAPLTIEAGELTATLKPRRHRIEALHRDTIERLYRHPTREVARA